MATVKFLQELCLTHITMTLEQYSTNVLSLLPKKFREQLLHNIPVLDICRLEEDSSFTAGIDMELVWNKLYGKYIENHHYKPPNFTAKEFFFCHFYNTIIRGNRPYGYFHFFKRSSGVNCEDGPVYEHNIDYVNFLVATKPYISVERVLATEDLNDGNSRSRYRPISVAMNRHEVTLVKGPVPPGRTYHESCRINQLVPPRYAKFFFEDSCYLPDSTALQLITEKCHFRPKEVLINVSTFATFLLNVEKDCGSVDCLKDYFQEVESVSIEGVIEKSQRDRISRDAKYDNCRGVAGRALELFIQAPNCALSSIKISLNSRDDVLESIEPVLIRYGSLTKFAFHCLGHVSPNFSLLSSITENQPSLASLSISSREVTQVFNSFHSVTHSHLLFEKKIFSWIQTYFKNPSLKEVKLSIRPSSTQFVMDVLTLFLSKPCSHEQTLTFGMALGNSSIYAQTSTKSHQKNLPVQSNDPSPTYQFDDALTLKYKCLSFNSCTIYDSFIEDFFKLGPLKVKKMSFERISSFGGPKLFSEDSLIEMESLEIIFSSLPVPNKEFFECLSQKKLLKSLVYKCWNRDTPDFDVLFEHFKKISIPDTDKKTTFIFTRK